MKKEDLELPEVEHKEPVKNLVKIKPKMSRTKSKKKSRCKKCWDKIKKSRNKCNLMTIECDLHLQAS